MLCVFSRLRKGLKGLSGSTIERRRRPALILVARSIETETAPAMLVSTVTAGVRPLSPVARIKTSISSVLKEESALLGCQLPGATRLDGRDIGVEESPLFGWAQSGAPNSSEEIMYSVAAINYFTLCSLLHYVSFERFVQVFGFS